MCREVNITGNSCVKKTKKGLTHPDKTTILPKSTNWLSKEHTCT